MNPTILKNYGEYVNSIKRGNCSFIYENQSTRDQLIEVILHNDDISVLRTLFRGNISYIYNLTDVTPNEITQKTTSLYDDLLDTMSKVVDANGLPYKGSFKSIDVLFECLSVAPEQWLTRQPPETLVEKICKNFVCDENYNIDNIKLLSNKFTSQHRMILNSESFAYIYIRADPNNFSKLSDRLKEDKTFCVNACAIRPVIFTQCKFKNTPGGVNSFLKNNIELISDQSFKNKLTTMFTQTKSSRGI